VKYLFGVVLLALTLVPAAPADDLPAPLSVQRHGGVAGGDALYIPRGDILNVRNIQGGVIGDTNLDIGAGSTQDPGSIAFQFDVGTGIVDFFNGRTVRIVRIGPDRAEFFDVFGQLILSIGPRRTEFFSNGEQLLTIGPRRAVFDVPAVFKRGVKCKQKPCVRARR
jgi:hypothetical protein